MFKFSKIFREDAKQEDIYTRVAQDLVDSAIEGYNGTIFAYGQTGSGKTYTMTGGDDDPTQMGIIPRVINDLYKEAEVREEEITIKLKYMQIYNKNGYDLLHPENKSKKLEDLPVVKAFCKGDNF